VSAKTMPTRLELIGQIVGGVLGALAAKAIFDL
jgi:hypothetical protein